MRLIDADELLENNTWDFFNEYGQYTNAGLAVKDAPTIEPKHGRWKKWEGDVLTCSNCKRYWIQIGDQYDYHYCPNCGAKMDLTE